MAYIARATGHEGHGARSRGRARLSAKGKLGGGIVKVIKS
jgi:hypothetical protein